VYTETLGVTPDEIIGRTDHEVFPPEMAQSFYTIDEAVMASGQPRLGYETELPHHDGGTWWISEYNVPYRSADGTVTGLVGVAIDITARKVAEEALRHNEAQLREIITQQDQLIETIKALASPVLPIEDQILVLPLVGHIDSARGEQILNAMLTSVQQYSAAWLIIDITGVPVIDTAVAHHLLQAARGVSLLGAHCMLVGVSPEIAQTLVQLGVDLSTFTTLSNLQMGIAYARSQLPRMRARHV
jgi:rsbT co-antagonist protein RsbR